MEDPTIVHTDRVGDRWILIRRMETIALASVGSGLTEEGGYPSVEYHCGYVEWSHPDVHYDDIQHLDLPEEPTFSNFIAFSGRQLYFMGFDTAHYFDTPETQSLDAVLRRTVEFARRLRDFEHLFAEGA